MKKTLPIGLRTVKTALAVTLAVLIVRLYSHNNDAIYYAAMGAAVGMDITVTGSLRQGLTQLVGVICGTLMGVLALWLFPEMPALAVGGGVLLLIVLCNVLKIGFGISLSCIIFLSATLTSTPEEHLWLDAALRIANTAVGILIALLINGLIHPYKNRMRIEQLLRQCQRQLLSALETMLVSGDRPDLDAACRLLQQTDAELKLYHAQRLFQRRKSEEALLRSHRQLCGRMLQELEAICGMDTLGDLSAEQALRLRSISLCVPESGISRQLCTAQDSIVMNYHLDKLLAANQLLDEQLAQSSQT